PARPSLSLHDALPILQRQPTLLDVDPAHPPEKGLGRRPVGLVLELAQVRAGAARAAHLDIQRFHDGEPTARERLHSELRWEGEQDRKSTRLNSSHVSI